MSKRPLDVFVFGVARSGTTLTYTLVQEILSTSFDGDLQSTYEPFIWNVRVFDDFYRDTRSLFQRTSSLSIDGIYSHLQMPMFIEKRRAAEDCGHAFFRRFSGERPGNGPHVAKLIRGNGRMAVFRGLNPDAKFVLVLRNPIDNVNSVKNKFSFYGDDFYPSDFERFCDELGDRLILNPDSAGWAEKQAEYSIQMNRAALEFASGDSRTLIFEYDHFVCNQRESVAKLCDHLGVEFRDAYVEHLESPVGAQTPRIALSELEYRSIEHYEDRYQELCDRYGIDRSSSSEDIHRKYRGNCRADCLDLQYEGVTTDRLRTVIREKDELIRSLEGQVAELLHPRSDSSPPGAGAISTSQRPVGGTKPQTETFVAMHNTRLYPKNRGAAVYRLTGIAARCDWVLLTDSRGQPHLRGELATQPRTVFVSLRSCNEALPYFRSEVLPRIKSRFVLISGSEDFTVPNQIDGRWRKNNSEEQQAIRGILGDDRLIHWFIENRDEVLPKTSSLPVGYVFEEQSSNLVRIEESTTRLVDRPLAVLCAHRVREGVQWDIRRRVTALCRDRFRELSVVVEEELPSDDFLKVLRRFPFALCVHGGGLDPSPKAWMCIANGTIPIIKSSPLDDAYKQLPVAFVEEWNEECLTPSRLTTWIETLSPHYEDPELRRRVLDKLSLDYWWSKIVTTYDRGLK